MYRYKIYVELDKPAHNYAEELLRIGWKHCAAGNPILTLDEMATSNVTDYFIVGKIEKDVIQRGNALVKDLQNLDFVVDADLFKIDKIN